jgi:hypothetical protein
VTRSQADQWIIASAVVTGGTYAYLRWQGSAKAAPIGRFVTAWGVVYVGLSIMALASPGIAAGFAMLVLVADLLANLPDLAAQINKALGS